MNGLAIFVVLLLALVVFAGPLSRLFLRCADRLHRYAQRSRRDEERLRQKLRQLRDEGGDGGDRNDA